MRLLVTSQELLKCVDEQAYRLASLALPDAAQADDLKAASRCSAVALFIERAHAADPRFALGTHNVAAVIDICRRLDERLQLEVDALVQAGADAAQREAWQRVGASMTPAPIAPIAFDNASIDTLAS